ncbi:MAG: hypothetical protein ACI8V9_001062, partial [Flavobacteriaceae bacterium]
RFPPWQRPFMSAIPLYYFLREGHVHKIKIKSSALLT